MARNQQKSSSGSRKRWKFEFGSIGMVGLCSVVALIMVWAFILGILVGRGYKPESVIAELGPMVPPLGKGSAASSPPESLLPEELRFFEILQEGKLLPATPPRKEAVLAVQPAPPKEQPAPLSPVVALQPTETVSVEPRFEFVYQVAAFQTDTRARALQQRLADAGGTTSVEVSVQDGRPWYRVLMTLRGSTADAEQLKNRLQAHGLTAPFLRVKKSL